MVNDVNNIFSNNNFGDSAGGTEIMVSQLLKYVDNELLSKFDWIVSSPVLNFERKNKPTIMWVHDLSHDGRFHILHDKKEQEKYDFFVFVSHWQEEKFRIIYNLPRYKCYVIKNAIERDSTGDFDSKWLDVKNKTKICYTSMPHKGIQTAFEVFKEIYKIYGSNVEFNVFSGYGVYGEAHESRNAPYESIYSEMKEHVGVNYYGAVPHEKILAELKLQHIWFHPSEFPETSAISMMEAASSKCLLIYNDLGALPETGSQFGLQFKYDKDTNNHAEHTFSALNMSIKTVHSMETETLVEYLSFQKAYFDSMYSWDKRLGNWNAFLHSIKIN